MAYLAEDFYEILSDGLYSGATYEVTITDDERATRVLSHGLLAEAPTPVVVPGDKTGGLNDVGTATTL